MTVREKPCTTTRTLPTADKEGAAVLVSQHPPQEPPQEHLPALPTLRREYRGPTQPGSKWLVLFPCPGSSAHTRSPLTISRSEPHPTDANSWPKTGHAAISASSLEPQLDGSVEPMWPLSRPMPRSYSREASEQQGVHDALDPTETKTCSGTSTTLSTGQLSASEQRTQDHIASTPQRSPSSES